MVKIETIKENDFISVYTVAGKIKGIVQHAEHLYKIMSDHFGDTFFVAREDPENGNSEIIGFMLGFISQKIPGYLFIWQIAVAEKSHGEKLGSRLLEYTIDQAIQKNCKAVMATVETTNTASQKLFEKFGFSIDSGEFKRKGQKLEYENNKEAIRNYYNSGTDQIFYVKKIK